MSEILPCALCGNTFIECFGTHRWWVGCKPCSKRDPGQDHQSAKTQDAAIAKWNCAQRKILDKDHPK